MDTLFNKQRHNPRENPGASRDRSSVKGGASKLLIRTGRRGTSNIEFGGNRLCASRGRPAFRVVSCHDHQCQVWVICTPFFQKPKNFIFFLRRVQQRSIRSVELCAFLQTTEPSHVSLLRRLFLPKVKHHLKAAPTVFFYINQVEEA